MKLIFLMSLLVLTFDSFARTNRFPSSPDLSLTPGSLCATPDEFRYPEQISYCKREVNAWQKELVFISYRELGFSLSEERNQYKVDHFIPLCLGGSNEITNLWPQFVSVSQQTDPLEPLACEVLAKGRISQREAINLVMEAKMDATKISEAMKVLKRLRR